MRGLFVSYRREDSQGDTGRIYDRFIHHFKPGDVFRDLNIPSGEDFVKVLEDKLQSTDVLIAIIGPRWPSMSIGKIKLFFSRRPTHPRASAPCRLPASIPRSRTAAKQQARVGQDGSLGTGSLRCGLLGGYSSSSVPAVI
jgi:hypothetical protein